jgi:tetratricopeptide (TPR) repeat protein
MQFQASRLIKYLLLSAVLGLIAIGAYCYQISAQSTAIMPGSILVFPVHLVSTTSDPQWNNYNAMDTIIHRLNPALAYPLLQTEDVIDIMLLASAPIEIDSIESNSVDIKRIFAISGASLIIRSKITSLKSHYQLTYQLHQKSRTQSETLNGASIEELLFSASAKINLQLKNTNTIPHTAYHSNYGTRLIEALKNIQAGDIETAQEQLKKIAEVEPKNLVAKRLLANTQLQHSQYVVAKETLTQAIEQASYQQSNQELAKLRLVLAKTFMEMKHIEHALILLTTAKNNAAKAQDWLTLGHISLLAGMINERLGRNTDARVQFKKSIEYYQMLDYPLGKNLALNELAQLEMLEHNYTQAHRYINRSLEMVSHLGLDDIEQTTLELMSKIENKIQR